MPRIKPPRNAEPLPIPEDHTPPAEPIEIELTDDVVGDTVVELAPEPAPVPVPQSAPTPPGDDALVRAAEATRRAEDLQRHNSELQRQARERDEELARARDGQADAEYNSVLTAIAAEQSALDKAEADYAALASAGDWAAAAKAQRVIGTASARLDRLEEGKQAFDSKRETRPAPSAPAPTHTPQDFESKLAAISGLPDNAKSWLRKHPEFVNDVGMNDRIGATHNYLTKSKGVAPFSDAYFEALDSEFGFKAAPTVQNEPHTPEPQPQRRSIPVSAPVSRDVPTPSGQRQPSKTMTLTPEERLIARTSFTAKDMSNEQKELLYARNKAKLQQKRANGEYPQAERN